MSESEQDRGVAKLQIGHWDSGPLKVYSEFGEDYLPEKGTEDSAGFDIRTPQDIALPHGYKMKIDTGLVIDTSDLLHMKWNKPFIAVLPRSSAGCKHGIRLRNSIGVVDADYNGPEDRLYVFIERADRKFEVVDVVSGEIEVEDGVYSRDELILPEHGYDSSNFFVYGSVGRNSDDCYVDKTSDNIEYKNVPICRYVNDRDLLLYEKGERFAQMLVMEAGDPNVEKVAKDKLGTQSRGGFGSTGDG